MKSTVKRIMAIGLVLAIITSVLNLNWHMSILADAQEKVEYDRDFAYLNLSEIDDEFMSSHVTSDGIITNGKPSEQWSTAKQPTGREEWKYQNNYLKPKNNGGSYLLTLNNSQLSNFKASITFLNAWKEYGLVFGQSTPYDIGVSDTETNGTVKVRMQENAGRILAQGVKSSTAKWVNEDETAEFYYNADKPYLVYDKADKFSTAVNSTNLHTLNIEVNDGVLKLWWTDFEKYAWTVELNDNYDGGYVSLYSNGCAQGGIKSFSFSGIREEAVDGADCDFTALKYVYQLNRDFDAYLVEKDSETGIKGEPEDYWTTSDELLHYEEVYKNPWLKPMHLNGTSNNTLLTYSEKFFENLQVSTEFVTNYVRYGVMVAPLGKISSVENGGVRVYVESNGIINIEGAIDAASANAVGGQVKITDKNHLTGYPIADFVSPSNSDNNKSRTSYKLNVKIVDGVITVWLDEFASYKISAKLTNEYEGGYASLYASGYNQGAFKSFKVEELESSGILPDEKTFTQSFNTIDSTDKLKENFAGYKFNNAGEKLVETQIDELFVLNKGKLKSNLAVKGTDDSGFAILTFKNKKYENFELNLSYEQDWLRYGVMLNSNIDEFAFTSVDGNLVPNGGVIAYTEAEGYTNIRGSLYTSCFTNKKQLLHRKDNITVSSFNSFGNTEKTLQNKPVHTLTIRVVNGYITMLVDGDESTRITQPLLRYNGGYISLITNATKGRSEGAFYGLTITELEDDAELLVPVLEFVDGENCDFTNLGAVYQLDRDFDAYLIEKDQIDGIKGAVDDYWTMSDNLENYEYSYKNPWLKPMHRNTGKNTLLTYNKKSFENVEISTEYVTNYVRYGVMVAPLGKISTAENGGVRVYVESNGIINIEGAVDAGSGKTTKGQLKVVDKNHLSGYAMDGIVGPSATNNEISRTSYKLNVKIVDSVISVWLDEYSDYVISAKLTKEYKGGYVSLYASAYDQGAFKNFKVSEIAGAVMEDDGKTFRQSFNTISSLSELKNNFDSYLLNSAEEKPIASSITDLFLLENGRLKSNLSKNGTDSSGIAVLTLKNKRYENFELTLSYEQDWLRYGVMFGTKRGDYAFTSKNNRIIGNGGVVAYTEAEGYTNAKGSMYVSSYTSASQALCRKSDINVASFQSFADVEKTLQKKPIHSLTVRVVNGYMTMLVDNDETTRITVRLADYDGGYISLITNAAKGRNYGGFYGITITELSKDAQLEVKKPEVTSGFETISQVASKFDAYYLADAEKSTKLEKVDIRNRWWINNGGYLSRITGASGIKETSDVEILTYKKRKFTDFELTYTYQQTYQRIGIMIGGDLKDYPLYFKDGKLAADKGALFFVEAEGYPNVKGHLNNYTSTNYLIYRTTNPTPQGFTDVNGMATDNVNSKKEHTVKIVVKDKKLYAYIDGGKTPFLYVKLGDNYNGGYVSLFSSASEDYGIRSFEISNKITTKLPKASGVESDNKTYTANFDSVLFDDSAFETYYLDELKNNADGSLIKKNFDEMWTVANGTLKRNLTIEDGSDASRVTVLTYNKKLEDFVIKYDYQKYDKRLMLMFGTEKGKYPLANKGEGDLENGGVLLYPENDLGAGGGIIAIGGISPLTAAYRPVNRKAVTLEGYHIIDKKLTADQNWTSNFGSWHTMTVAVINKHCYIYLDDYGLIADYDLKDDYDGGYISLAAAGSQYGFDNISITDLSNVSKNTIVHSDNPRDITVKTGTKQSEIKLPSNVKATLKDGKTISLPVEWQTNYYDKDVEGIYSFTAILPENANVSNTALVSSVINIRVKDTKTTSKTDVKEWTFDTSDDLLDFKSTYLIDGEKGYTENNISRWYCNGELLRDSFRTINGSEKRDLSLLTYDGATYRNFELEVDYTQHYTRMGVLFGSSEPCQYIDLSNVHGEYNPVMAFVEYEGVRNFIGNVKNTNFYTRIDETIYNARENGAGVAGYFTEANAHTGNYHKMKIRVVGEEVSMWIDDSEVPFTATLTNYTGGYISLVSTTKGGKFDNLKITRLDDVGNPVASQVDVVANGNFGLEIDKDASTELKLPVSKAPDKYKTADDTQVKPTLDTVNIIIGCAIFVLSIIFSALVIIVAINKKRKKAK